MLWEGMMEVEIPPTVYRCPSCGEKVVGLDATEREINEAKWFYRGILTMFAGIFFTSFSIWVRGVSAESESLGAHPPPTDVIVNLIGWLFVVTGFVFWYMSWKLHEERLECTSCGIEIDQNMPKCINCGIQLIEGEEDEYAEEEPVIPAEEPPLEVEVVEEIYEEEVGEFEEAGPMAEAIPAEEGMPVDLPEDIYEVPEEPPTEDVPEPALEAPTELYAPAEEPSIGDELPTEHEEHKKCPECGIFVDMDATICPTCDASFEPAPSVSDAEIEVPSEDDELDAFGEPLVEDEPIEEAETAEEPVVEEVPEEPAEEPIVEEPTIEAAPEDMAGPEPEAPIEEIPEPAVELAPTEEKEETVCPGCGAFL
ncbi:MAG: hypothetical protein KAX31_06580, partial [Thermoplasmata archaeon]|nr:hypothetical protein [Thermoplasmata archaeon]